MTKSQAKKLANIINYFDNKWQNGIWVADVLPYFGREWQVEARFKNSAYINELNALMMVISNTITPSVSLQVDDKGEFYWKIW